MTANASKPVSASRVTLSQLMQPQFANLRGAVHGGWIMKLADEAGGLAAARHARSPVVTVAIDQMSFHSPIRIGDLVILEAEVTFVGNSSLETRVQVTAEDPLTGVRTHTNTAYLVYVALDQAGRPTRVPRLVAETEPESRRLERGERRQADRLARLKRETQETSL
ncbi:MAG: acyl-CoA thioesterase [Anaerolineales bacterium]